MYTIQSRAEHALAFFAQKVVSTEEKRTIWITKEGSPEWLNKMVLEAVHDNGNILLDNYRYEFAVQALEALANGDEHGETLEPDIYTTQLTAWLHSAPVRVHYITDVLDNFPPKDGFELLAFAQIREKTEVFYAVKNFLEELLATET